MLRNLKGLEGIKKKEMECEFIKNASDLHLVLDKQIAATSSGDNGALNIWKDDSGAIRCTSMAFCETLEAKIFDNIKDAEKWAKKWLLKIN